MISDAINSALADAWANVWYYISFSFLDPFWGWAAMLAALYVVVLLFCWLFGSFWPVLRVIGGFLLIAATFGLWTYARGAKEAREHDRAKKPSAKPKPLPGPWRPFGS